MSNEFDGIIYDEVPEALWPNCTAPDCPHKACIGLSDALCFPHYFKLPMKFDEHGELCPVFPDEATKTECYRLLREALDKL